MQEDRKHQYYLKHREEILRKSKINYQLQRDFKLKQMKEYHLKNRQKHLERFRIYDKQIRKKETALVIAHYSNNENKCDCCGESDPRFLTVDHINGGGHKHRKATTKNTCRWLLKNNFPNGFQILCFNCNLGRERNHKVCPHQDLK
jgi:hypothetical protein